MAGIVPIQLMSDSPKSSSAQRPGRFLEKVAGVPATGPFHNLCPSVFYPETSTVWSSSGSWIWPGIQRNHGPLLFMQRELPLGMRPRWNRLGCIPPNCRGRCSHPQAAGVCPAALEAETTSLEMRNLRLGEVSNLPKDRKLPSARTGI